MYGISSVSEKIFKWFSWDILRISVHSIGFQNDQISKLSQFDFEGGGGLEGGGNLKGIPQIESFLQKYFEIIDFQLSKYFEYCDALFNLNIFCELISENYTTGIVYFSKYFDDSDPKINVLH